MLHVQGLNVEVARKPIKNLHVAVYPPDGHVRVSAPQHLDDETLRLAVIDRLAWIRRQQRTLRGQPRESKREMVTGETHYLWGRRYRMRVKVSSEDRPGVQIEGKSMLVLTVGPESDRDTRERTLTEWYRRRLKDAAGPLVDAWAAELNLDVVEWRIRKMRTKWGSCNAEAGRIWINLELAKKPPPCLDYIVVHEMLHLVEPEHNARFEQFLDDAMPNWRTHRDELYRLPLGHEDWPERVGRR